MPGVKYRSVSSEGNTGAGGFGTFATPVTTTAPTPTSIKEPGGSDEPAAPTETDRPEALDAEAPEAEAPGAEAPEAEAPEAEAPEA